MVTKRDCRSSFRILTDWHPFSFSTAILSHELFKQVLMTQRIAPTDLNRTVFCKLFLPHKQFSHRAQLGWMRPQLWDTICSSAGAPPVYKCTLKQTTAPGNILSPNNEMIIPLCVGYILFQISRSILEKQLVLHTTWNPLQDIVWGLESKMAYNQNLRIYKFRGK